MAECRGLAPLARGHALVSTEARLARPVDIPRQNGLMAQWIDGLIERPSADRVQTIDPLIHESNNPTLHAEAGPRGRTRTCNRDAV